MITPLMAALGILTMPSIKDLKEQNMAWDYWKEVGVIKSERKKRECLSKMSKECKGTVYGDASDRICFNCKDITVIRSDRSQPAYSSRKKRGIE